MLAHNATSCFVLHSVLEGTLVLAQTDTCRFLLLLSYAEIDTCLVLLLSSFAETDACQLVLEFSQLLMCHHINCLGCDCDGRNRQSDRNFVRVSMRCGIPCSLR